MVNLLVRSWTHLLYVVILVFLAFYIQLFIVFRATNNFMDSASSVSWRGGGSIGLAGLG
jgi:hypothetical protein